MLKMCPRMAATHTLQIARAGDTYASIVIYSDAVSDPTTLLADVAPTSNKLIEFVGCTLGVNADGFIKITNLSAAAQAALASASGTAKWFRLLPYSHTPSSSNSAGANGSTGIYVGEVGNTMGQHALMLSGGNAVVQGQPKPIQSLALKIKQ